ncbi:hypothetical protein CCHR01_08794 [Colletotrichum chrysophilum]|uniref:Uncharacterized protein n=1 Tax=Colletotrichum chrysophilum TaxID=1836956 RepID=A0AAD9EIC0_9PEZI|nr:hypothetical protein CCHR01_08794 [Colletotrichum chrysophilum]
MHYRSFPLAVFRGPGPEYSGSRILRTRPEPSLQGARSLENSANFLQSLRDIIVLTERQNSAEFLQSLRDIIDLSSAETSS